MLDEKLEPKWAGGTLDSVFLEVAGARRQGIFPCVAPEANDAMMYDRD